MNDMNCGKLKCGILEDHDREFFEDYKKLFPEMDLELISTFARTMMIYHHQPILFETYFHKMGLTKSRFMVLVQLYRLQDEGMSMSEICRIHRVKSATMTGIIDTLEREGHIERFADPSDRRKVMVRITEDGKALMEDFLPRHQENVRQMAVDLTTEEMQALLSLMTRLYKGIQTFVENNQYTEAKGTS